MRVGVKFGMGESISPHLCTVSPHAGQKDSKSPHSWSNLNTGVCNACILLVIKSRFIIKL